jgi:hypothetical protein
MWFGGGREYSDASLVVESSAIEEMAALRRA